MSARGTKQRRELMALGAAGALHAIVFLLIGLGARGAGPLPSATPSRVEATEVELSFEAPSLGRRSPAGLDPAPHSREASGGGPRAGVAAREHAAELDLDDSAAPAEAYPEPSAPESVPEGPIDLGIDPGGWRRWVFEPGVVDTPKPEPSRPRSGRYHVLRAPPASTTGGLQEGLEKRDRELGLGPSGRVVSALHAAAHTSSAPSLGTALFHVTVLEDGAVELALGTGTDDPAKWLGVAEHALRELRLRPPRIPPPRDGVRLVIAITAEETMPNGLKTSSLHDPRLELVPLRVKTYDAAKAELEADNPTADDPGAPTAEQPIRLDLPGIYLAERGKVCGYRLGLSVLGPTFSGGCDLAHLGAKPQRMVRAQVTEETLF